MALKGNGGETARKITEHARQHDNIAAIYLFGSVARGTARATSDIDLAVMSTSPVDGFARIELETAFSMALGRDVDLVIFHQAEPLLQHQILKHGRLLYEQDAAERIKQETRARQEYLDSRFLFRELAVEHG